MLENWERYIGGLGALCWRIGSAMLADWERYIGELEALHFNSWAFSTRDRGRLYGVQFTNLAVIVKG